MKNKAEVELKKDEVKLSNGDILTFRDFDVEKPKVPLLRALFNIRGIASVVMGGEMSGMGDIFDLFPHVVRSVRLANGTTIVPSQAYCEELNTDDGLIVYGKLSQALSFLRQHTSEK